MYEGILNNTLELGRVFVLFLNTAPVLAEAVDFFRSL